MAGERAFVDINVKRALLREYLKNEVRRAGFGGAEIQRTPMGTRVTLITERPGLVIGRKGDSIKAITDTIQFKFGFDKPQVEVVEIENPNLSAQFRTRGVPKPAKASATTKITIAVVTGLLLAAICWRDHSMTWRLCQNQPIRRNPSRVLFVEMADSEAQRGMVMARNPCPAATCEMA